MTHAFPTRRSSSLDDGAESAGVRIEHVQGEQAAQRMAVERLPPGIDRIAFLDRGPQFFEQKLAEAIAVAGRISFVKLFQRRGFRSEEHTSELQSLMRISYAVFCLKQKKQYNNTT